MQPSSNWRDIPLGSRRKKTGVDKLPCKPIFTGLQRTSSYPLIQRENRLKTGQISTKLAWWYNLSTTCFRIKIASFCAVFVKGFDTEK